MEPKTAFALKSLAAADLAPSLCDAIQTLYETNLAIAREKALDEGMILVAKHLSQLPKYLGINFDDVLLKEIVQEMLE
jgi:hypothetical protein